MATSESMNSVSTVSSGDGRGGREANGEIERLYKKFTYKCLQIIVQSRIETSGRNIGKDLGADFFSITLPDDPGIEDQIKKSLEGLRPFPLKESVCVEIPLVTNDGDHMCLETWHMSVNLSSLDMSANRAQHIYTRMGVTLKSLLCATRATPAYKLAKNQGEKGGGYKLNYRIYVGKPQTHNLGDGFKSARAGAVPSSHGLLTINVAYRTRLLISPEMSASSMSAIEVTDNYFDKEAKVKPAQSLPRECSPPQKSPEFRDDSPYHFAVSPTSGEHDEDMIRARLASEADRWSQPDIFNMDELPEPVVGAFSDRHSSLRDTPQHSMPFEGLMKRSLMAKQALQTRQDTVDGAGEAGKDDRLDGNREEEKENVPNRVQMRRGLEGTQEEDFIMVDKPPFAADDDPKDVKAFLGLILRAPNLFDGQDLKLSVDDYLSDVGELVDKSEEEMPALDEFCQSVINMNSQEEDEDGLNPLFS